MSGFVLLLSLYGSSLYHNWIVRDREMRDILDKTRSVEEEKKSRLKQNQQEKKESLHDKRRKKSMQIKKQKRFKHNKKKKKVIEAQSTSLVWRAD